MMLNSDRYHPEMHRQVQHAMDKLVAQLDFQESLRFSVFFPLVSLTQMLNKESTREQGGLCLRQIAHCCRVMAALDATFYGSPWHQVCLMSMAELGAALGWYETTLLRWQRFASGQSL
ncbi:hypothetical protein NB537_15765 [Vibrio parahaemolyticus]|nr:hypothetical protein [Vibrio parahaemolyticus]MCR9656239.1 hypothetical protein [Vibrio parahaemolyticus]